MLSIHISADDGSSKKSKAGVIAGATVAALAGLSLIVLSVLFSIRNRRNKQRTKEENVTAFPTYRAYPTLQPPTNGNMLLGKAAQRQEALDRLERAMEDLRRRGNQSPMTLPSHLPGSSDSGRGYTESELANQIAELRLEVANLRSQPHLGDVLNLPPPEYQMLSLDGGSAMR
jgi:hypothetical protein